MISLANRMSSIEPFHVMDILAHARQLEAAGNNIVHMEVGEPDFVTLPEILEAGRTALAEGKTHYTPATGLAQLREAISAYYQREYDAKVPANRIVVTPGASGALQLALGVLVDPGDGVIMADPGYPCNRHMVSMFGGIVQPVNVTASSGFQLNLELVQAHWQANTRIVMLASPSNPTGTLVQQDELNRISHFVREQGGVLIVDEIYHGLIYVDEYGSAVNAGEHIIIINSFSKYFGMTGWRVGWMVVPEQLLKPVDNLAQNIFLAAPTPSQYAALAALDPQLKPALDERRDIFRQRRDYLLTELLATGFQIPCEPRGAFYIYANCAEFTSDSLEFSRALLDQAGVAITPGIDFGGNNSTSYVRFAYTTGMEQLAVGVDAIRKFLSQQ